MKLTDKQIDIVLAYVRGEMSEEAFLEFKQGVSDQKAIEEEVAFQKSIGSALKLDLAQEAMDQGNTENTLEDKSAHPHFETIRSNMNQARTENEKGKNQIRRLWMTGVAAACVLFVCSLGFRTYLNHQLDNSLNVIVDNADIKGMSQKIDGLKSVSGRSTSINYKLEEAQKAYQNKDWDKALATFDQLEDQLKYKSAGIDYCKSIIFFNKKEYERSIQHLENIDLNKADSPCEIHRFLTLSYLKIKNKHEAKKQFELLAKNTQNCDQQLMKQLNKFFLI